MAYAKADLPSLMKLRDGAAVATTLEWELRRTQLRELLCDYFFGHFPKESPPIHSAVILSETEDRGARRRIVQLTYDTDPPAALTIELLLPVGEGPFPVFMTQTNHRRWGLIALSRGYLVCVYPGADIDDQSYVFRDAYPAHDWTLIPRRAWTASRVLDYVVSLPEADRKRVGITGHSRNGKQALIAAAFDERFAAVVSGSSGSAGAVPYRFASESAFAESVEFTTRLCPDWFHLRLREFVGREHQLPVDIHALLGLIAPRHCLLSTALNDGCETTFAVERSYLAGQEVYRFLEREEALRLEWRFGGHEIVAGDVHRYVDFFDRAFGRGDAEFRETLLHRFDWASWRAAQPEGSRHCPFLPDPPSDNEDRRARLRWLLGEEPPSSAERGGVRHGIEPRHTFEMMERDSHLGRPEMVSVLPLAFGDGLSGHLWHNPEIPNPMPVVLWLHPYSYSTGYTGAYRVGPPVYHALAERGYAVFAYDQLGFGTRLEEGRDFYRRFPTASKLGAMARDVRSAVDCLTDGDGRLRDAAHRSERIAFPPIDTERIFVLGYSLGGMVGLMASALDDRIAGVASFCGFTPFRTDTDSKPTGGIRRLWEWHGLLPRLGLFHRREAEIPADFEDVLYLIAPRPCLIVSPTGDREADSADVARCVESAREAWHKHDVVDLLTHLSPDDYNRFQPPQHGLFLHWLTQTLLRMMRLPVFGDAGEPMP